MYKMTDEVIGQIGKLVQLAIITGTDVIDNLRMIEMTPSDTEDGKLSLTPEYREVANSQLATLLEEVENITQNQEEV